MPTYIDRRRLGDAGPQLLPLGVRATRVVRVVRRRYLAFSLLLTLIAHIASSACAADFVFETETARWVIGSDGRVTQLRARGADRRELLQSKALAFAEVKHAGKWVPATALERNDGVFRATFGTSGVEADFRITAAPRYVLIELINIRGDRIEQVRFAQVSVNLRENTGNWLNVRWNDEFAVCLMGLSDRIDAQPFGDGALGASVWPEFGMDGGKAVLIATPTSRFLETIRTVEVELGLPSPTLSAKWAKRSPETEKSYLFTSLTAENVGEVIRRAKLGGFGYILIDNSAWTSSLGSYPINRNNFPDGEESLKAAVDKCHAAGLKVGLHLLTSFVSKGDALVRPRPDPRLLKDAVVTLAADVSATAREIPTAEPLDHFPLEDRPSDGIRSGTTIVIDDEIIRYGGTGDGIFTGCIRGFAGTSAAPHKAGTKVYHLAERYNAYLVDLRTSLKGEVSQRIAEVVDRCGFDMIYLDGGEVNNANGPYWYWVSQQQIDILQRIQRDVLVHGSGLSHWTWHWFSRGTCDDYAVVATKPYLDLHKIGVSWQQYHRNFLPAELGWLGVFADKPEHPATLPDEMELYAVRSLALNTALSIEAKTDVLNANGRTDEMLRLLGRYESLRASGLVSASIRERLKSGEWKLEEQIGDSPRPVFRPVRYETQRVQLPAEFPVRNSFHAQELRFRLKAKTMIASPGDERNIQLHRASAPVAIHPPGPAAPMPGWAAATLPLSGGSAKPVDLSRHRALAITVRTTGREGTRTGPPPVLNIQLEASGHRYRDYYIDLDFDGEKTVILPEATSQRMLAEFRPNAQNYAFKLALSHFRYDEVVAAHVRWMRAPVGGAMRAEIISIEALAESETVIRNPRISAGGSTLPIRHEFREGDYAEFSGDVVRFFDRNGRSLGDQSVEGPPAELLSGSTKVLLEADTAGVAEFTTITLGDALQIDAPQSASVDESKRPENQRRR